MAFRRQLECALLPFTLSETAILAGISLVFVGATLVTCVLLEPLSIEILISLTKWFFLL
jgi:hypothetical protein